MISDSVNIHIFFNTNIFLIIPFKEDVTIKIMSCLQKFDSKTKTLGRIQA